MIEFAMSGLVTIHCQTDGKKSKLKEVKFNLDVTPNLDRKQYLDAEGMPTKDGVKALTQCFVQGLAGNIHAAHQRNQWDSAEHMRYAIAELEKAFVQVTNAYKGTF
jgi:hypothetical protein